MIHGKPMIQRVYEQASQANFSQVVVATDDERIFNTVKAFGGNVVMTANDHETGTERCAEAFSRINSDSAVVVNIQGDEPMIDPEHLNRLVGCFADVSVHVSTLISKLDADRVADPNTVKVAKANNGNVLYFSRSPIPYDRHSSSDLSYFKHLGVYAYRVSILPELVQLTPSELEMAESLEQLRWLENGYSIKAIEVTDDGISVDTPEDLNELLTIWKEPKR